MSKWLQRRVLLGLYGGALGSLVAAGNGAAPMADPAWLPSARTSSAA